MAFLGATTADDWNRQLSEGPGVKFKVAWSDTKQSHDTLRMIRRGVSYMSTSLMRKGATLGLYSRVLWWS